MGSAGVSGTAVWGGGVSGHMGGRAGGESKPEENERLPKAG